jgi:hypothetical protein
MMRSNNKTEDRMKEQFFRALFILLFALYGFAASTSGSTYYLDPVNGSDENDGSASAPWKSFKKINSYYQTSYRPSGWVELMPGDTILLKNGVYSEVFQPGEWQQGPTGGGSFVAYFRGRKREPDKPFTIKALPGHKPIIDPKGKGIGLSIFQSSHWQVEGIDIRNAYGRGLNIGESQEINVKNVHIHDTDGIDNNNIAGLYLTDCWNVEVAYSEFNDNYDRTCADTNGRATENSCNVVIFGGVRGGNVEIHHCKVYQSLPLSHDLSGGGIKYKHASRLPDAFFHVHHNEFRNCKFFAFGSGTANTHFHHNLIMGGAGISSRDFGGITHQVNQVFEHNTLYDTSGFELSPTTGWRNAQFPDDPKSIVFRKNIVYDTRPKYSNEHGIVVIGTYITDETYRATIPELTFRQNCYFNPNGSVQFNMASGFNHKEGYTEGGVFSLEKWWRTCGYDADSIEADPRFIDLSSEDFRLKDGSPSKTMGAFANAKNSEPQSKVPVIYCTDLFHPHEDPDDHFDIACLYAMPEIDLRLIVLDQGGRQQERPGSISVSQLNHITGRNVSYAIGLASKLQSPEDGGFNQSVEYQSGIERIISNLQASKEPVTIIAVGSLRDVAAAYNRSPSLFKAKVGKLLIFIGEASLAGHTEYNVGLDTNAYIRIMNSGLPVYWVPCFDGGLWQNKGNASYWRASHRDLLGNVSNRVMNYFAYALLHKNESDPVRYLDREPSREDVEEVMQMHRNLWCTAVFPCIAGRRFVRQGERVMALPAGAPHDGKQVVVPFQFEEVSVYVNEKGTVLYEDTSRSNKVRRFRVVDPEQYSGMMASITAQLLRDLDG